MALRTEPRWVNNLKLFQILVATPAMMLFLPIPQFDPVAGRISVIVVACILAYGVLFRGSESSMLQRSMLSSSVSTTNDNAKSWLRRRIVASFSSSSTSAVSVNVSLESLCIDSKVFVLNELVSTYHILGPQVMDLSMLAFGNAKIITTSNETKNDIQCQHGLAECDGNSYMQCAVEHFGNHRALPFVACLFATLPMGHANQTFAASKFAHCARRAALDWPTLQRCHDDPDERWRLQVQTSKQTPQHDHVPWIQVDGQYVSETSSLLNAVCDAYVQRHGGAHPACSSVMATMLFA